MHRVQLPGAEVQEYDSYVKGGISLSDFLVVMKNREQDSELRTRLLKIFQIFDRDGSPLCSQLCIALQLDLFGSIASFLT